MIIIIIIIIKNYCYYYLSLHFMFMLDYVRLLMLAHFIKSFFCYFLTFSAVLFLVVVLINTEKKSDHTIFVRTELLYLGGAYCLRGFHQ